MNYTKDMTEGNPAKLLFFFAVPLMLGSLFQQLYTMVDTIIVGQGVGVEALASLGAADWTNWLFQSLVTGLTQGFSILFAQHYGAGKYDALKKALSNAVILSVLAMVCLVVLGEAAIVPTLKILRTPDNIFPGSCIYLRIMILGVPVSMLYNLAAALLRALGDSRSPLMAMVVAALVNIGLDLLFVMGFGMGIPGAAVATVLAQGISFLYCMAAVRKLRFLQIHKEDVSLDMAVCRRLLFLGTPVMFQNVVISVGGMVVQAVVNQYGFLFVAGFTATNKLYGLLETAAISFGFSMTTYAAQNLGAGKLRRVRRGMNSAAVMAAGTSVAVSAVMLLFGKSILSLFISGDAGQTAEVLEIAYHYLSIMSYVLVVLYALHVYRSCLQGLGNTIMPMVSGVVEFMMRVGAAVFLPKIVGQEGIFYAEILAWTGAAVLLVISYYHTIGRLEKKAAMADRT